MKCCCIENLYFRRIFNNIFRFPIDTSCKECVYVCVCFFYIVYGVLIINCPLKANILTIKQLLFLNKTFLEKEKQKYILRCVVKIKIITTPAHFSDSRSDTFSNIS